MKKPECKLDDACLRSSWVIAKDGSFEMLATKWPSASWALRTEAEPGDPGKDSSLLSFQQSISGIVHPGTSPTVQGSR